MRSSTRHPRRNEHSRAARDYYQQANRECARIIAADSVRYPGIMQTWARLVLDRERERQRAWGMVA
jgi:hypothetical protein